MPIQILNLGFVFFSGWLAYTSYKRGDTGLTILNGFASLFNAAVVFAWLIK